MNAQSAVRQYDAVTDINPQINTAITRGSNIQNRFSREQSTEAAVHSRDSIMQKRADLQASRMKEEADVRQARNSGASSDTIKKELEEAKKVIEEQQKYAAATLEALQQANATIRKNSEAIRNLPRN